MLDVDETIPRDMTFRVNDAVGRLGNEKKRFQQNKM